MIGHVNMLICNAYIIKLPFVFNKARENFRLFQMNCFGCVDGLLFVLACFLLNHESSDEIADKINMEVFTYIWLGLMALNTLTLTYTDCNKVILWYRGFVMISTTLSLLLVLLANVNTKVDEVAVTCAIAMVPIQAIHIFEK